MGCFKQEHSKLASNGLSSHALLVEALATGGRVDFPTVTEICEHADGDVMQMMDLVRLLASSLQESYDPDLVKQLKVVTVLHELLHDAMAQRIMIETPELVMSLQRLREYSLSSSDGPAHELVVLLASEILKRLHSRKILLC